jgi:BirA family biotin operon repressor/biotin-[acetyl-CoA-carboxylase] ligase
VAGQARDGAAEGLVAVADFQTAGRGRLDRTWEASPGAALLVSVLLRPDVPPAQMPFVMIAVGLAAADGVEAAAGVRPGLKWPNDLVAADDRKLAGILAEGSAGAVVAGIGINVAAGAYPPELAETATSCEEIAGRPVDREAVLQAFLAALAHRYAALATPARLMDDYQANCVTLGRRVKVQLPDRTLEGFAVRIADDGRLMITDREGAPHRISAGDVIHLR